MTAQMLFSMIFPKKTRTLMPLKHNGALGGWRPWTLDTPIDIQHSINLAYLQLIPVLVYGRSPPKTH